MKSYYVSLTGIGESCVECEDVNIDNLGDNEAVVKAEYSLISAGTELSRAFALKKGFEYPVRPGYSTVGRLIAKGKNIKAEIGDKVFASCPHASLARYSDGDKVQGPMIFKIDEDLDSKEATILNLMLVAIQGVNLSEVKLGYTVGVFGLGNIGIITALMYKKLGCRVIALDPIEQRCTLAKELGVEYAVSSKDQKAEIDRITNGEGLDIAVDVTGLSQVINSCIENTKAYGQVILLGSPRQSFECDITPSFSKIHMKNLKVIGAFNRTCPKNTVDGSNDSVERNIKTVCQLLKNKDIDVSKMISRVVDPKECKEAYYDLMYNRDKATTIIFDWSNYN